LFSLLCAIPSKIGIPSVGRERRLGSGLLLSVPGCASHETTPHKRPSQSTILMRATRLATIHSPVGSIAGFATGCAVATLVASKQATNAAENKFFFTVIALFLICTRAIARNLSDETCMSSI